MCLSSASVKFTDKLVCSEMGITFEHIQGTVAGNSRHFHNVECSQFKQSANCFMTQIVKMEIDDIQALQSHPPGAFKTR
ncbi:Uncharacterised protein [Salmonella enterica subsp. enterica serovar Typhi]|nr:Uncharacterised protein [Salmonella enterica subsp. enterica serovar Typhi]CIB25616.1 Uncharacterised protein [Salmonella enterica subsp. enterica serovar Typhi]